MPREVLQFLLSVPHFNVVVKAEEILARPNMALALAARIEEVPEGATAIRKKKVTKGQPLEIRIDNYSPGESPVLGGLSKFSNVALCKTFWKWYVVGQHCMPSFHSHHIHGGRLKLT
jgi:hypothetical protein